MRKRASEKECVKGALIFGRRVPERERNIRGRNEDAGDEMKMIYRNRLTDTQTHTPTKLIRLGLLIIFPGGSIGVIDIVHYGPLPKAGLHANEGIKRGGGRGPSLGEHGCGGGFGGLLGGLFLEG